MFYSRRTYGLPWSALHTIWSSQDSFLDIFCLIRVIIVLTFCQNGVQKFMVIFNSEYASLTIIFESEASQPLKFSAMCRRVRVNLVSSQESFHAFMPPNCATEALGSSDMVWIKFWEHEEQLRIFLQSSLLQWRVLMSYFAASSPIRQVAENAQVFTCPGHGSGGETCTGMWFLAEFSKMLWWDRGACLTLCSCLSQRNSCLLWSWFLPISQCFLCAQAVGTMWEPCRGSTGWLSKTLKLHPQSLCLYQLHQSLLLLFLSDSVKAA